LTVDLDSLQKSLNYAFENIDFLELALRHRSVHKSINNERLEFLGDSLLNMVIAEFLFRHCETHTEGELSRSRASLVKEEALARVARRIALGQYLSLGSGELKSGGFRRDSILSDALEAVFGAAFLDGGFEVCKELILTLYQTDLQNLPSPQSLKDPKTRLQEYLQAQKHDVPHYRLLDTTGKSHQQTFVVECQIPGLDLTTEGRGGSRKKAEQMSASLAIEALQKSFHVEL